MWKWTQARKTNGSREDKEAKVSLGYLYHHRSEADLARVGARIVRGRTVT
ncbi:hypothetical protein HanPI659440_Chr12g0469591 [Helianthus annuus]|nr:hypothetical protein HanPI659440_Chr12g0469591 [Helianthus annuus]